MPDTNAEFDIHRFVEDGFTIIEDFLDKNELKNVFEQMNSVLDVAIEAIGQNPREFSDIDEKYDILKRKNDKLRSHCYDVFGRLDSIHRIFSDRRLLDFGHLLYRKPLFVGPMQVRIDDPSNDRLLPWHQELEQLSLMTLNVWVPLRPSNARNGGLEVIPGSHKLGLVRHDPPSPERRYYALPDAVLERDRGEILDLPAGSALVFHPFLAHASVPNRGRKIRWTLVCRYSEPTTAPYIHSADAPLRMDRNPTPELPGHSFLSDYLT